VKRSFILGSLIAASACAGCEPDPSFSPISKAPPGAVADYHEDTSTDARTIIITEGLAFALECADGKSRPCTFDGTSTADPEIATVRRAYGDLEQKVVYGSVPTQTSHQTRTLFVVVGHKAGRTSLFVHTGTGIAKINIEVLAAS
jgi:hypothetical protein